MLCPFERPLVLILIGAAPISLILRQWVDGGIIRAIVLLGFFQEHRASAAVSEMKKRLALTARVIRDGRGRTIPASAIVPGDLIVLSAGNLVPKDGRVIAAQDFLVNEASMTASPSRSRSDRAWLPPPRRSPPAGTASISARLSAAASPGSSPSRSAPIPNSEPSPRACGPARQKPTSTATYGSSVTC